jgi:hypothetical protein
VLVLNTITQSLAETGKACELFATSDGTRLLLLPYGARVVGLYAPESAENFFWTNPLLDRGETARLLFANDGWHNTGGDRTWVAPELDTFFRDATFQQYWQPRQLDMSDYTVDRAHGGIQLTRKMTLHLSRANCDRNLRLTKWFGPAANPLRCECDLTAVLAAVQYAGYSQRVVMHSLDALGGQSPGVGIWNLVQLPPGGEMIVPLYRRQDPQKCFGDIPADRVNLCDHLLRIQADFSGSHKIAMKAAALCGRTGYLYARGDAWSLVVRNFFVNPSGHYIDVQRHDMDDFGYAFQMCRVDETDFGSFCEMEYHAPALGAPPDPARCEDVSQLWAFRGPRVAIDAIMHQLLGAHI